MTGISINDLRKNLRDLNEYMDHECRSAPARYGVVLDASLITGIDPPPEVESALAAINTAHNQVSSDISLAQAAADQRVVQSRRAVEIETLRAQAEVEPIKSLAAELAALTARRTRTSLARLPAQRAPGALRQGPADLPGGRPMMTNLDRLCRGVHRLRRRIHRRARSLLALGRIFGLYAVVQERTCRVYVLFGKVVGSHRRAGPALPAREARDLPPSSSTFWATATCSICGSTRSTCAASR